MILSLMERSIICARSSGVLVGSIPLPIIANLGLQVSLRAKNNLKLASFFLNHKTNTRRVAVLNDIMLDSVRLLRDIKESEK